MRLIVLGLVAMLTGGAPLFWGLAMTSRIRDSASWPSVDGTVVDSRVRNDSSRIRGGGYTRYYTAVVRYEYRVDGRRHESDVFAFGVPHSFSDLAQAQAEVAAHSAGTAVKVYHDPAKASVACLSPGKVPHVYSILLGVAGIIALAGLLLFGAGIRTMRTRR